MNNNTPNSSPIRTYTTNNNTPNSSPIRTYTTNDLRNMEVVLLKKIEKFNTEYSNYKKYLYNTRHNIKGDTSVKFTNSNKTPITSNDFSDININIPISETPIYIDLIKNISDFNEALQYVIKHAPPPATRNTKELQSDENKIIKMRNNLDQKLRELYEIEGALSLDNKRNVDASILMNILWTTVVTSLIYYIIVHQQ